MCFKGKNTKDQQIIKKSMNNKSKKIPNKGNIMKEIRVEQNRSINEGQYKTRNVDQLFNKLYKSLVVHTFSTVYTHFHLIIKYLKLCRKHVLRL